QSLLDCHLRNIKVTLAWIPGHSGIQGNETVDSYAKEAVETGSLEHYHCFFYDLFSLAKSELDSGWQRHYDRSKLIKGRYYSDIQPSIPTKPWFFRYRLVDKQTTSVICRLRIGHTCTPSRLHRWGIIQSPICVCGLEEGTEDHILFNCPNRSVSLYNILPSCVPKPIDLKSLLFLSSINKKVLNSLIKFIHSQKIKL
ncbi:jg22447, partial [Pararge aegeria aegeria]